MFRIQRESNGCSVRLLLSGRIQSDEIACIRLAMDDMGARKTLDLSEVTLVDIGVVRFLIDCQAHGIELEHCPLYVREWMSRERVEEETVQHGRQGCDST